MVASARSRSFSCAAARPCAASLRAWLGVELARLGEIRLGLVVVGKLHVQHAAGDVERRRRWLQPEPVAQDLDAHLERLMRERDVREVEIQVDVPRAPAELPAGAPTPPAACRRPSRTPRRRGPASRRRRQRPSSSGASVVDGVLRLAGHQLHGRQQLAPPGIRRVRARPCAAGRRSRHPAGCSRTRQVAGPGARRAASRSARRPWRNAPTALRQLPSR